jgi:hypothetical protein
MDLHSVWLLFLHVAALGGDGNVKFGISSHCTKKVAL